MQALATGNLRSARIMALRKERSYRAIQLMTVRHFSQNGCTVEGSFLPPFKLDVHGPDLPQAVGARIFVRPEESAARAAIRRLVVPELPC